MKITQGHYDAMKKAIDTELEKYGKEKTVAIYESGNFPRSERVKILQRRFCFDMMHFADISPLISEIYEYANDDHIYTALKKICPKVERKY